MIRERDMLLTSRVIYFGAPDINWRCSSRCKSSVRDFLMISYTSSASPNEARARTRRMFPTKLIFIACKRRVYRVVGWCFFGFTEPRCTGYLSFSKPHKAGQSGKSRLFSSQSGAVNIPQFPCLQTATSMTSRSFAHSWVSSRTELVGQRFNRCKRRRILHI